MAKSKMVKTTEDYCSSCKYGGAKSCNYYLMTLQRRNCQVGECDKYEYIDPKKKQSNKKSLY